IKIEPAPNELVRVMGGRVEILTPGKEREIAGWFGSLDSKDAATRGEAAQRWAELGRLQEPVLHRLAEAAADPAIRAKAVKLLAGKG
ncbi:MAG TPA: hypothetical protein VNC50_02525, partial [Planctomycetia bacterium]|nr:hypothetical protein [Planctomycetia bacterium]